MESVELETMVSAEHGRQEHGHFFQILVWKDQLEPSTSRWDTLDWEVWEVWEVEAKWGGNHGGTLGPGDRDSRPTTA